jgi:hypothetical protein
MNGHIALLGDSIFDNAAYTNGEPDVVTHLRTRLPEGWRATLLAVDGSTTESIPDQLRRLPPTTTHLVVAVGGNDVLAHTDLLSSPCRSTAEALSLFGIRVDRFETSYRRVVRDLAALDLPTVVCTIYNGNFEESSAELIRLALIPFNDVIFRTAFEARMDLIDLRLVCSDPDDYANPIEPSGVGGGKIAAAILRAVGAGAGGVRPCSRIVALPTGS